jgi:hypothetical protein
MKGFIKVLVIVILVGIISIFVVGGICCFTFNNAKQTLTEQFKETSPATLEQRAKSIANYTLPVNYQLEKALDFMGIKVAIFKYQPDNQFLAMAELPQWAIRLNEQNFKESLTPEEIQKAISQSQSRNVRIKDIKIEEEGTLKTATREVPFVRALVTAEDTMKNTTQEFEVLMSVISFSDQNKNVIVLTGNTPGTFNINAAKEFISTIEVN